MKIYLHLKAQFEFNSVCSADNVDTNVNLYSLLITAVTETSDCNLTKRCAAHFS